MGVSRTDRRIQLVREDRVAERVAAVAASLVRADGQRAAKVVSVAARAGASSRCTLRSRRAFNRRLDLLIEDMTR